MADGDSGAKGIATEVMQTLKTDIADPLSDEVGQLLETGKQSVFGPLDPQKQAQQQKQAEESKKQSESKRQRVLKWIQDFQKAETQQNQQTQILQQKKLQEDQEDKQKKEVKQFQIVQKKQQIDENLRAKQAKTEIKRGVGG